MGAGGVHEKCEPQARPARGCSLVRQGRAGGWFSWCPFGLLLGQAKSDRNKHSKTRKPLGPKTGSGQS